MGPIVVILHVGTKNAPICPRFSAYDFYRDASSALLQIVNQWLSFTYSRSHAFRATDARIKIMFQMTRVEFTTSHTFNTNIHINTVAGVQGYLLDHSDDEGYNPNKYKKVWGYSLKSSG